MNNNLRNNLRMISDNLRFRKRHLCKSALSVGHKESLTRFTAHQARHY